MRKLRFAYILVSIALSGAARGQDSGREGPWTAKIGPVLLRPAGSLHLIETIRSATVSPSVNTPFGKIPLTDSPSEAITSARHTRMMLTSDLPLTERISFRGYLESDFMNIKPGQSPYRWRQYWGQAKIGSWEVLAGQAWSLLRPNRRGIYSDIEMMNTNVLEPAYHTGLVGLRYRQVRVTRPVGKTFTVAAAWESNGNRVVKLVRDGPKFHWELQGLSGTRGRIGAGAAGTFLVTRRLRLVTQEFWSKRAISEALNIAPAGASGVSAIQGAEFQLTRNFEIYGYAGAVYASRSPGNRLVASYSAGINRMWNNQPLNARLRLAVEYSHVSRSTWTNGHGQVNYVMASLRYIMN